MSVISTYIILTPNPIESTSNGESKPFKPIYFISCVLHAKFIFFQIYLALSQAAKCSSF